MVLPYAAGVLVFIRLELHFLFLNIFNSICLSMMPKHKLQISYVYYAYIPINKAINNSISIISYLSFQMIEEKAKFESSEWSLFVGHTPMK